MAANTPGIVFSSASTSVYVVPSCQMRWQSDVPTSGIPMRRAYSIAFRLKSKVRV